MTWIFFSFSLWKSHSFANEMKTTTSFEREPRTPRRIISALMKVKIMFIKLQYIFWEKLVTLLSTIHLNFIRWEGRESSGIIFEEY